MAFNGFSTTGALHVNNVPWLAVVVSKPTGVAVYGLYQQTFQR
jgi:hypothetical protein